MAREFQRRRVLPPPGRPSGAAAGSPTPRLGRACAPAGGGEERLFARWRELFTARVSSPPAHLSGETLRCGIRGRWEAGSGRFWGCLPRRPGRDPCCPRGVAGLRGGLLARQVLQQSLVRSVPALPAILLTLAPGGADPPPPEGVRILSDLGSGRGTQVMWPSEGWAAAGQVWAQHRRVAKPDPSQPEWPKFYDILYWVST